MGKKKIRLAVSERTCGLDKKQRYYTSIQRASNIDDEQLIKMASDDSGIRIEQIAAVYRSLFIQVKELVCNGHSVQLGDLGTLHFKINAKITEEKGDAGGQVVKRKKVWFQPSKHIRNMLYNDVTFDTNALNG